MAEKVTLDANILIYAFDESEPEKQPIAEQLLWLAQERRALLTTNALGEFFWAATRKGKVAPLKARRIVNDLITMFGVIGYGPDHLDAAMLAVAGGRFSFWDAVMLAAAEEAGCTICFSEDMKDGARMDDIVVRNPFGAKGLSAAAAAALAP
ncbi:MAG: PIN domain-containing protein [Alphaproteobacteria bacterium]|nr:PIN domain-containing protein [Alphaproteobacteria bacterium]MBV9542432.1 PIN domain-containing protein [Alphaproteobacteria bacterium]MBV9905268.1 PIN domain-containing protein [Alphaproteobacteria bacterium]